jgi:hypothetical protein
MASVNTDFPLHDPLGIQAGYSLQILDENDDQASATELGGVNGLFPWVLPPQNLQIRRSIRAEILKDIGSGISSVSGGEGIGRIVIAGTYGIGPQLDPNYPSLGKNSRDGMVQFFQAFLNANDERGRVGKSGLSMLFKMSGGKWTEPDSESYYVWPESFPMDLRGAGKPLCWDWQCSLMLLAPYVITGPFDFSSLPDPNALVTTMTKLGALVSKIQAMVKKVSALVTKLKNLRSKLLSIATRIKNFVAGVKNAIYEVTDLIQGTAQILQSIKKTLNLSNFKSDVTQAISSMVYSTRVALGQAGMVAASYTQTGTTSASYTPGKTVSTARATSVGLNYGDTLAALAAKHLGSSAKWKDLVTANGLEFPYLDFSGTNGVPDSSYASKKVLGKGDILRIPLATTPGVVAVSNDPIGTDLPDEPESANVLQGGTSNLSAAAIRRIRTPMGRIPWHPFYGSRIMKRIGTAQTLASARDCQDEVITTLKFDKRILNVGIINISLPEGGIVITASIVSPLGVVPLSANFAR